MDQQTMDRLVEAIVEKLIERSRKLLVLYTGSPLGLDVIDPQLDQLKSEGYTFSVFATEAGRRILDIDAICRRLDAEDCSGIGHPSQFLDKGTTLIVPSLTQNTAVKWSMGINDNLAMDILADALARGYEAVASTEGCCPNSPSRRNVGLGNQPDAYKKMMQDHLQALRDYGVHLAIPKNFYAEVKNATRLRMVRTEQYHAPVAVADPSLRVASSFLIGKDEKPQVQVKNRVITLADITTQPNGATIEIPKNAIITPSARERIRDFNLVILRRD